MDLNESKHPEVHETAEEPVPASDVGLPNADLRPSEKGDDAAGILDRLAGRLVGLSPNRSGRSGSPSRPNKQVHDRPSLGFD